MKRKNEEVRRLTVTGQNTSYYVTIPKDVIRELKWRKGQRLVVKRQGKKVVIEAKKRVKRA